MTDEQTIATAGEPVALIHLACIDDGELRPMTGRRVDHIENCELYAMHDYKRAPNLYTADDILSATKPLRDRIAELEANASTMKAYYEQVFEDGGKRIAELTKQRDGLLLAVTKIKSDAGNPERVWRLAKEDITANKTGGAA